MQEDGAPHAAGGPPGWTPAQSLQAFGFLRNRLVSGPPCTQEHLGCSLLPPQLSASIMPSQGLCACAARHT